MDKSLPFAWSPVAPSRWRRTVRRNVSLGRQAGVATAAVCIALAAWFAWTAWPRMPAQDTAPVDLRTFAHWHDAGHDWLLKLEPEQGTLSVYDAADGRPLRRLAAPGAREIVLEDNWLFVLGQAQPQLLRLPGLAQRHDGGRAPAQP